MIVRLEGVLCGSFIAGTRVAVRQPDLSAKARPIEDIVRGDLVLTQGGQGAECRSVLSVARHPDPALAAPVLICANAIGPDVPRENLLLLPEAMLHFPGATVDDPPFLVPAAALINGTTIRRESQPSPHIWYTLELETDDIVLAENVAVAAYGLRDNGEKPSLRPLCARLIPPGPALLSLRTQLSAAAQPPSSSSDFSAAVVALQAEDLPRLFVEDREIQPESGTLDLEFRFLLPPETGPVRLVSASYPSRSDLDKRSFGVCVLSLKLNGVELPLNGEIPGPGFYPIEGDEISVWRWTSGDAWLLLPHSSAARSLHLRVNDWHRTLKPPGVL